MLAEQLGLITETYRKNSMYCAYTHCPHAAKCKAVKCGEDSARLQKGKSKGQIFCMHPGCKRGFHVTCWAKCHRLLMQ